MIILNQSPIFDYALLICLSAIFLVTLIVCLISIARSLKSISKELEDVHKSNDSDSAGFTPQN